MKKILIGTLTALGMLAGAALLETPAFPQAGPMGGGSGAHRQQMLHALLGQLDLTEAQKVQAHEIFSAAQGQAQPLAEQMKAGHTAIAAAVKANNTPQIDAATAQMGAVMGKLAGVQARAFAQFYAILTPEQQAKADKLHEMLAGLMASHLGGGGPAR